MGSVTSRVASTGRVYYLLILVSLLWFMVLFIRYLFPPLFGTFQSVYGVSNTQTGLLFTVLMLAYATVQFPAGVIGDRVGLSKVILWSAILFSAATLLVAFSPSYVLIMVAAMIIGISTGPQKTVAIPLLSRRYPEHLGRVLGVMDTVGLLGGMAAPLVVVILTGVFVWQSVFVFAAGLSGLIVVLFYSHVSREQATDANEPDLSSSSETQESVSYKSAFTNRRLLTFVFIAGCHTFVWNGVSSFLPLFLTAEKGISAASAGALYSVLFAMGASQTITGESGDRFGKLTVAFGLFVLLFIGVVLLINSTSLVMIGIATVIVGLGVQGLRPVRDAYLMDLIPDGVGGGALGAIRTFMTGVGALAPATVGFLSDVVGFTLAFTVIGATTAIAALLTFLLR